MEKHYEILRDLLIVIAIVLPIVVTYLVNKYKNNVKNLFYTINPDNEAFCYKVSSLVDYVATTVDRIVVETNQSFVNELKRNGEFTKDKQQEAFSTAFKKATEEVSNEIVNMLEKYGICVEPLIGTLIEYSVSKNKEYTNETTNVKLP